MTQHVQLTDLEFSALLSSKICHDIIGPVGAIYNGLEVIGLDDDAAMKSSAFEVVRNVVEQASARLQFARFAFGAAGTAGAEVDLHTAQQIAEGLIRDSKKHRFVWSGASGMLAKNKVKLLLNLVACALTSVPRGGVIEIEVEKNEQMPKFTLTCSGRAARPPLYLGELIENSNGIEIDAMSIQAYYTLRLACETDMNVSLRQDGEHIVLQAMPSVPR